MSANSSSTIVFQYYLTQIQHLYLQYNLSNIQNTEVLLNKFPGKEYLVYIQICKKCGVEPEKQRTAEDIDAQMTVLSDDGKVSKWLTDKGFLTYAEMPQFRKMMWEVFKTISTAEQLKAQGVKLQHIQELLTLIRLEGCVKEETKSAEVLEVSPVQKPTPPEPDFVIGDDCYTKVLKAGQKDVEEGWLKAKVMRVNKDDTYDIYVHNATAHGVPPEAVNVPRKFLKKSVTKAELLPPAPVTRSLPDPKKFSSGDRVWVCGLRSHQSYNGLGGTIVIFHEKRWQVELDNGELFAIRPENLFSWDVDVPKESVEEGLSRLKGAGFTNEEDEELLRDLITKLMRYDTSRSTDHLKLGQFAAGYMIAQRRFLSKENQ